MIVKSSFSSVSGRNAGNLDYISREGALHGHRPSVYDREGIVIDRDHFKELKGEIKEAEMERRFIFSPADKDYSQEEIGIMVRDVIERCQTEGNKNYDYVYAVHDHNDRTHAHVIAWGDRGDLEMDKDDLTSVRDLASELEQEKEIDLAMEEESFGNDIAECQEMISGDFSQEVQL